MVGAADADSRWWLRGKWGGTTRPWYEIMLYDRNIGGGTFYAGYWYDGNDTGYYIDPNGSSQMRAVFANDWFRPQGCCGVYWQSYGRGIWSPECEGNSYGHIATYGGGRNGWYGYGIASTHALMTTTGDNIGLHDNRYSWIWYWDGGAFNVYRGYTYMVNSARSPIFYDSNDTGFRSCYAHV